MNIGEDVFNFMEDVKGFKVINIYDKHNVEKVNIENFIFEDANVEEVNVEHANVEEVNMEDANVEEVNVYESETCPNCSTSVEEDEESVDVI